LGTGNSQVPASRRTVLGASVALESAEEALGVFELLLDGVVAQIEGGGASAGYEPGKLPRLSRPEQGPEAPALQAVVGEYLYVLESIRMLGAGE
jgi:hypothetical protein